MPGRARRLRLPPELARDAHSAAHGAGLARRRVRGLPAARLLGQHAVALRARAGDRPRRRRRDRRRRGGRAPHRGGDGAARRDLQGDVRGAGPGRRHRAHPGRGLHPGRLHGRRSPGRLYQQFALTIAVSVLISAFNALTLSPALARAAPPPAQAVDAGRSARLGGGFNRWFGRATDGYVVVNRTPRPQARHPARPARRRRRRRRSCSGGKLPSGFVPDEDQGYAIIGVQLPDGASLQRTRAVYEKVDAILAKQPGIRTYNGVAGFSFFTRTAASYTGTGFVGFKPWDERKAPELTVDRHRRRASTARSRRSPRRASSPSAPPAIPGISAAGGFSMMLQDRSGGSYEFLAQNVGRFVAEARKRPELAGVRPNFSPGGAAALRRRRQGEGAQGRASPIAEIYNALQTFLGGSYVNDFTPLRPAVERLPAGRAELPDASRRHRPVLRAERDAARWCRSRRSCNMRTTSGPEYTVRFNLYRSVEILGAQAPGYSSGQALDALEDVAAEDAAARDGLRVERALLPGEGRVGRLRARARAVARLRVPHPRRALRELVAAVQRAPQHAGRGARRVPRAAGRATSTTTSTRRSGW